MKNIIFWGGFTTHVFELTQALARKGYTVKVIRYTQGANEKRTERIPQYNDKNVEIIECNDRDKAIQICRQYERKTTLHINGSIKVSNAPSFTALKYLLKNGYRVISIPQEGFQLQGLKGKLNYLKWLVYLNMTWRRNMTAWGLTGLNAERQFRHCGVKQEKLFQFLYITQQKTDNQIIKNGGGKLRFIFVGAIDKRKNIIPFVRYMQKNFSEKDYIFNIYGSWDLDSELKALVADDTKIFYHGKQPYDTVRKEMQKADYLILSSLYDGWGAVGNEGLQSGCRLIISKQSGCSVFPHIHKDLGYVFDAKDFNTLNEIMNEIFAQGPLSDKEKKRIIKWADMNISPQSVADYFDKIINHFFNGADKPAAPWTNH